MDTYSLIARLSEHQGKIMDNFASTERLVADGMPVNVAALVRLRGDLMSLLTVYQHFKHHEIFDVIISEGPTEQARIGRRLKAECVSLGEEVRDHVHRWTDRGIAKSWDAYRPALLAFIYRIKAHMEYERRASVAVLLPEQSGGCMPPPALTIAT